MKFIHVLICAALLSFLIGLIYATESHAIVDKVELPHIVTDDVPAVYNKADPNLGLPTTGKTDLKPCSQTTQMPCDVSPPNPLKESLEAHKQRKGLFYKGEKVTCIYPAVMVTKWSDGTNEEYLKTEGIKCKVVKASEEFDDLAPGYQHIQVNCEEGLKDLYNLSATSKLNYKERWFTSDDCYHFVEGGK